MAPCALARDSARYDIAERRYIAQATLSVFSACCLCACLCLHTLRGVGFNVAWCDEGAFMRKELFFDVILPIAEMRDRVLVVSSTPTDDWGFFHQLMTLRTKSGDYVFRRVTVQLVCQFCRRHKRETKCTHNIHKIPPWKSQKRLELVKLVYGKERERSLRRESLGVSDGVTSPFIPTEYIEDLGAMPEFVPDCDIPPLFVHITVDPNAGGPSEMAIVAVAYQHGRAVVSLVRFFIYRHAHIHNQGPHYRDAASHRRQPATGPTPGSRANRSGLSNSSHITFPGEPARICYREMNRGRQWFRKLGPSASCDRVPAVVVHTLCVVDLAHRPPGFRRRSTRRPDRCDGAPWGFELFSKSTHPRIL